MIVPLIPIVLLLALFLFMLGGRREYFAPQFNPVDASAATDVIMRLSRSMVDRDSKPVETVKLILKRHEVQMLVNTMIRNSNASGREFLPYAALWDDGFLRIHCSARVFGSAAVNIYLEITPVIEQGKLSLIPGDGRAGRIPLPRFVLRSVAGRISRSVMRNETACAALSAFILFEPRDDGTILVMFAPRDVNAVVNLLRSARKPPAQNQPSPDEEVSDEPGETDGDVPDDDAPSPDEEEIDGPDDAVEADGETDEAAASTRVSAGESPAGAASAEPPETAPDPPLPNEGSKEI